MGASSMLRNVFGGFKNTEFITYPQNVPKVVYLYVYLKMDKSLHVHYKNWD